VLTVIAVVLTLPPAARRMADDIQVTPPEVHVVLPPHLLFLSSTIGAHGGGGGGNRQTAPIRHAQGVGRDAATLPARQRPPLIGPVGADVTPPAVVLDAVPLASGTFEQSGLPIGGVGYGTSTGPGSGGGVGTGEGTGIGSGRGPGFGPGSGGGFGGGAYRPGAGVAAPKLLSQVKPRYTTAALERKIQGSVWLEIVVTRAGRVGDVRVQRSLDPGGLDEEAIIAVRQWLFEPGRLGGVPVDVAVTVVMDFWIH
jgi:TonB family protein